MQQPVGIAEHRDRQTMSSVEPAVGSGPRTEAQEIAAIIVRFGYPTLGVTPTVQAAMKLASLIVIREREAARPEPSLDEEVIIDNAVPSVARFGRVPRTEVIRSIVLAIHEQGARLVPSDREAE
jgi:hypothetical protein